MNQLQEHLSATTEIIRKISKVDIATLSDAKTLKNLTLVIDRVLDTLNTEISILTQIKIEAMHKIDAKIQNMKKEIQEVETKFKSTWGAVSPTTRSQVAQKTITVDVGFGVDNAFTTTLYKCKEDVPVLTYGAILAPSGKVLVVFRFGVVDFVSCTGVHIIDPVCSSDNYRTICCGNSSKCEYAEKCKYFHDPLLWPNQTTHVQRFMRSSIVKKCPYFGNVSSFAEHAASLTFEHLRTLARYCAVMTMMISMVCNKK